MKKHLLFAVAAMFGLCVAHAQEEEDVTSYLVNPGFDEDLTFQADGSEKTSVNTGESTDDSYYYAAEDSTVYANASHITSSDGRQWAVNGFIGRINGWTLQTGSTYPTCEWVYSGSFAYGMDSKAVPVAYNGTGYIEVPTEKPSDANDADNVGVLMLRAGWGGWASYSQNVSLSCAQYRLEYWVLNTNYENSSSNTGVTNLCQVTCRKDVFADEDGFNAQTWTKHTIEFTPTSNFTITLGMKSSGGSNSNPFLWIDGIKLYKIGEADPMEIYTADIVDLTDSCWTYVESDIPAYSGLVEELSTAIEAAENDMDAATDTTALRTIYNTLTAALVEAQAGKAAADQISARLTEISNLLSNTDYPGKADLQAAYESAETALEEGGSATLVAEAEKLEAALVAYYESQEASDENPADYTFLVKSPYFTTTAAQPTIVYMADNAGIESVTYPNADSYTVASAPSDGSKEGWYIGESGGDQRLNYRQNRVCWNAWRQSNNAVSINQDLTDIPNGYYTVSAEMITQPSYVTDQHVYATSSIDGTVTSASLTSGDFADDESGTWTYLTTPKILVSDGKLTIGALGNNTDSDGSQKGWFCVTNFRLLYYGAISEEETRALYTERLAQYDLLLDSLYYKADKAEFKAVLDAYRNASSIEDIEAALDTLASASAVAQASLDKYKNVTAGSLNDLKTRAADGTYLTNQALAATQAVTAMEALEAADDATYTEMDSLTTILRYYRDTYLPVFGEAESLTLTNADAVAAMKGTLEGQVTKLNAIGTLATTEYLDELIAELNKAIAVCQASEAIASGSSDLTSLIINPTCDASDTKSAPSGWSGIMVNSGNQLYNTSGQAYDGVSGNHYLDAWNSNASVLRYTAYQTLENIPNGIYELKAKMRTSGTVGSEGVYLFGYDDANDTGINDSTALAAVYAAAHIQPTDSFYVDNTIAKGTLYGYFTASYGPIWAEAFDAIDEGGGTEEQNDIANANSGKGWGWFYVSLQVTVTNNKLIIGVTNDSILTAGSKDTDGAATVPFTGTWYSADDFTLTLVQNNQTDYNPATSVAAIEKQGALVPDAIYTLDGRRVNSLQNAPRGIYVIRENGATRKVMKK